MPHLICPACQAKVPLKISAGETKVECPNCHKAIKVKLPSQQPAPANLAPAAPVVDELRLPQEPLAPLSDAPFPELSPAGDLDEYRLADERLTPLSEPPLDDLNMDEIAPLAPMEPPATAPLAAAPRPAEKRPSQAESDTAAGGKRGIILAAVGGGVGLLCLVLFGAWMMSGRGSDTPDATTDAGAAAPNTAASSATTSSPPGLPPEQFGSKPVEWFEGEFAVIDRPPDGAKVEENTHQTFTPAPTAQAFGPGGTPEAPAPWKAFPEREAPAPSFNPLRHYPVAWNDTHYIVMGEEPQPFTIAEHPGRSVYQTWWQRFDYKTSRPVSPRYVAGERLGAGPPKDSRPLAALSADGERFVLAEVESPGQITVYAKDGAKAATVAATPDSKAIEWLDWDAGGNLLTLSGGTLTSWSLPAAQPAWTSEYDDRAFATMSRGRDWLAVGSAGVVHLVNLPDGKSRGQLRYQADAAVVDVAIAPREQRLAVINILSSGQERKYYLAVWDLSTGKALRLEIGAMGLAEPSPSPEAPNQPTRFRRLFWIGDEQVAVQAAPGGLKSHFFRLSGLAPLAFFTSFQKSDMLDDPTPVFWGPHDTLWAGWGGERGTAYPVTLLSEKVQEHQEVFALMSSGAPGAAAPTLRVEVNAKSPEVSRRRADEIARFLVGKGVVIGPGGDTLRIRYGVTDSDEHLESFRQEIPIPKLVAHYQWLDAQGKQVWSDLVNGGYWDPRQTRYRVGQVQQTFEGEVRNYNFRGDMRTAIVDEILDTNRFSSPAPDELMHRLVTPDLRPGLQLPLRLKAAYPTLDELSARPDIVNEAQQSALTGLAAELVIPGQDHRAPQLHYSPDGTTLFVVAVVKQTRCLLKYDRSTREWVKATALTPENVIPAIASTLDRFAYHDQGHTLVADAIDPSRQLALPQRGHAELTASQLQLSAGARRLARVLSLERVPDYPRRVELWHVAERRLAAKHVSQGGSVATAFSPDGALFAAGEKQIRLWDTNTFEPAGSIPVTTQLEIPIAGERVSRDAVLGGLAFSRDGKTLAAYTTHKQNVGSLTASAIHLWRLEGSGGALTFSEPTSVPWRNHEIMALSLDRQGDRVAILSATNDWRPNHVELYSLARKVPLRRWTAAELGEPSAVAVSPEGDELAIAALDKIFLFDIQTPLEVAVGAPDKSILLDQFDLPPETANLSPTPPPPAALQAAGAAPPPVAKLRGYLSETPLPEDAGALVDLSFSENGRTIAVGLASKKFLVYTLTGQKPSYEIVYQTPADLRDDPHSVAEWVISPEHDRAAFLRRDGILCLFDRRPRSMPTVLNKRPVGERDYLELPVASFSPDGRLLCICNTARSTQKPNPTPLLEAWDLRQGKRVHEVEGFTSTISHLAFAAEGSLAVCIDSAVHLLNPAKNFAKLGTLPIPDQSQSLDPQKSSVAISGDGRTLGVARSRHLPGANAATHTVCVWSNPDGVEKLPPGVAPKELLQPGAIRSLAFDPAGRWLFTVCDDEMMKERWLSITDAQSGERRLELGPLGYGTDLSSQPGLTGEDLGTGRVAIAPSGQQLALTTGKKILMFDVKTLVGE